MTSNLDSLLSGERQRLQAEQAALEEQHRDVSSRLAVVRERLEHVRALLGEVDEPPGPVRGARAGYSGDTGDSICNIAAEILSERGRDPMHYKELAKEVAARGGVLNGAAPEATLVARMVQDPRFVRPTAKGFYALRSDYPTARNVGERLHRNRRRPK